MKRELITCLSVLVFLASCKEKKEETVQKKSVCITDSLAKVIRIDTAKTTNMQDELTLSGEVSFDDNRV